jgi:hypothetical protein
MPYANPKKRRDYSKEYCRRKRSSNYGACLKREALWREQNREKVRAYSREWAAKNRKRVTAYGAQWRRDHRDKYLCKNLRGKYGITLAKFRQMMQAQNERCAVCKNPLTPAHVDHCHKTKNVRELLCGPCNRGLGLLRDDPDIASAAANYLRKHRDISELV